MTTLSTRVISNFNSSIEKYERTNLTDLLSGTNITPQKFKQMLVNELERNVKLQEAFIKNPSSFFASALYCAELNLSPSSLVGEFLFTVHREQVKPILGYKGLVALLLRSDKVKKIWAEVVYNEDDFEYELGLEPKMVHIPNFNSIKTCDNIKCIYACAKVGDEIMFKVMTLEEIKTIVEILETPSEYYFNDKKDPEKWLLKKVVLKQMSKLMPKEDDRLLKAVSFDDNVEGGGYLVLDENDTVRVVQGTIIGKHNTNKKGSIYHNLTNFSEKPLSSDKNDLHLNLDTDVTSVSDNGNTKGQ
jgi:recombination protein RecT